MGGTGYISRILLEKFERKRPVRKFRSMWQDEIKIGLKEKWYEDLDCLLVAQETDHWRALVNKVINLHHHHWLDSPTWALVFLRSFCQLKYPAIASSDFMTRVFSRVGLSAPLPTPRPILEGRCFLSGLSPLAD
jgi:hypothetical protein